MKVNEITVEKIAEYLKLDLEELDEAQTDELSIFLNAAIDFLQSYTGLDLDEISKHKDFTIAVFVLVADMFENRQFHVDERNLNRVVETILDMHSTNLL